MSVLGSRASCTFHGIGVHPHASSVQLHSTLNRSRAATVHHGGVIRTPRWSMAKISVASACCYQRGQALLPKASVPSGRIRMTPAGAPLLSPSHCCLRRLTRARRPLVGHTRAEAAGQSDSPGALASPGTVEKRTTSSIGSLFHRFLTVASPYWSSQDKVQARVRLVSVFLFALGCTGVSVLFNFLGRDFYNALESKNEEAFFRQLLWYLAAFVGGIPVFVLRDYLRDTLALRWRAWLTSSFLSRYMANRTFYSIQAQMIVDNPDQRMNDDVRVFTSSSLAFSLALFGALIDLISFSGILYSIYPPLFGTLIVYSVGGTAISIALGKDLVGLNFMQEKKEADFRYGLVRVRENAESIAFYGGESSEINTLLRRFQDSFANYSQLLVVGRNLDFFTSAYRYLIQLLPAAVVAPLFFRGEIEFGVINQSFSAFNHVLADCSIIVYQFQNLTSFSAIIERLGEFNEVLEKREIEKETAKESQKQLPERGSSISIRSIARASSGYTNGSALGSGGSKEQLLLELDDVTLFTPQYSSCLVAHLSLQVRQGQHLLIVGPSGVGKTSLLRAIAGLWTAGAGRITKYVHWEDSDEERQAQAQAQSEGAALVEEAGPVSGNGGPVESARELSLSVEAEDAGGSMFFVPQKPYMVLGSLRQQLLYPTWSTNADVQGSDETAEKKEGAQGLLPWAGAFKGKSSVFSHSGTSVEHNSRHRPVPSDEEICGVLRRVKLGYLLDREGGLDAELEWSSLLSLGEQQRLAFARLLLSRPLLALMDESTSALDEETEALVYEAVEAAGVTFVSVAHRKSLIQYHTHLLRLQPSLSPLAPLSPYSSSVSWSLDEIKNSLTSVSS